jgi:molybdopterin guanine dinucleotide-containing S/N-oxide reductase-like protein
VWIPIIPGTDEALMAAIAYVWITQDTYDTSFISTHTVGFDQFQGYILGTSDGTPKTPDWAAPITGLSSSVITTLAQQWASEPTFVSTWASQCQRRDNGANFCRMIITLCAMRGALGTPGAGLGGGINSISYQSIGSNEKALGSIPSMTNPVTQSIRSTQFPDAILNPPISWTGALFNNGTIYTTTYPSTGNSEVHLAAFTSGSGRFFNNSGGINDHIQAIQSSNIEFVYSHVAWWEIAAKFSDIILPVAHVGEREDVTSWENYILHMPQLVSPPGEAMNDLDIFTQLATTLGFETEFTNGMTQAQWLQQIWSTAGITDMTWEQFQTQGYYMYPFPDQTPVVDPGWAAWNSDPTKNPLTTPSGLIEIYSQRVADGITSGILDSSRESAIPTYIPGLEAYGSSTTYPLYMLTAHNKQSQHSQFQNTTWNIDDPQVKVNGRQTMYINPTDATARGINNGDIAIVSNARGQMLCGAYITERIMPGTIDVPEAA